MDRKRIANGIESASRRRWLRRSLPGMVCLPLLTTGCSKAKAFSCSATTGLSVEQLQIRQTLAYVDKAPTPEQSCIHCSQYIPAAADGCGGCKVMPGPTHPNGHCKVFQAKS
jgi:hypothetical protein